MSQTERIIFIDKKLSQNSNLTINQIVEKFEISSRQAKRDIEYMRDRFLAPINYDHKNHFYKYSEKFSLTDSSDNNTLIFKAIFDNFSNANGLKPLSSSLISQGIDYTLDKEAKELSKKILFLSPIIDLPEKNIFSIVSYTMKKNYCIEFIYTSLKNVKSERKVQPLRLVNDGKAWYLIAYDLEKKELRNFHLSRMEKPKQLLIKYPYIENDDELESYISSGFGIFMNTKSYIAKILFKERAAQIVKTQTWHKDQIIQFDKNNLFLTIPFSSHEELLSKIFSFGSLAIPLEPKDLVNKWREEILIMRNLI